MCKVIAIMNKPKNCEECVFGICKNSLPLSIHRKAYYCQLKEPKGRVAEDFDYDAEVHLSNCPLKEVPEKKKERYGMNRQTSTGHWETYGEETDCVAVGYNACIDEILRGSEENE